MKNILKNILAWIIHIFYKLWCKSLRIQTINYDAVTPYVNSSFILALWHNEMFPLIFLKADLDMVTIASQSKDGQFITNILKHLGFIVARGSSSRGGVKAMLQVVKLMREQDIVCAITVDGPRGPRHKAKDGIIYLAKQSKSPIIAIRAKAEKAIIFNSWDRFILPLPFTKVTVYFANPYYVLGEKLEAEDIKMHCMQIENTLNDLA